MTPGPRQLGAASLELSICQAVPPAMRPLVREITSLYVPPGHRHRGEAKALLEQVGKEADERKMVLLLIAKPFGDEGYVDLPALERLYASVGFNRIQDDPVLMVRPCTAVLH